MRKINNKELHEIFQQLKSKNQNAYNKLYEDYYKLVYGIVFSILKNRADSEDVTHEVFTKIYRLDSNKLPSDHEASWLFTVSKNECLLFLRKSKPNINIDEIYEMPANSNGIDDVIDRDYYNKLISGLKEDEKTIVSLKILSNFTFKKISQVMNIPIGTVQWKYYNAINNLKVSLGSLVGAVMAFVFIIARGEFWKKKEYINNSENNYAIEDKKMNENIHLSEEDTSSESQLNDNYVNNSEIGENRIEQQTETSSEVRYNERLQDNKFDVFQIAGLTIGIVLFAIFIIFFKKHQQKFKIKPSK